MLRIYDILFALAWGTTSLPRLDMSNVLQQTGYVADTLSLKGFDVHFNPVNVIEDHLTAAVQC